MARLQRRSLQNPDEEREIRLGRMLLFDIGDVLTSYTRFEPGWRWSEAIKPLAGTELCEFHHQGYSLSGRVHVVTRDGAEMEVEPGEFFEIPPYHDAWVVGDEPWISIDWGSPRSFGQPAWGSEQRLITTILFTDIVDSTVRAREAGDVRWQDLLEEHNLRVRGQLARFGGRELSTTGDGFLVMFGSAERAVHAAKAIIDAVGEAGLLIRAGLHTGEVELVGNDVRGLAVHVGARVMSLAGPSEVLVSWTTRDLLAGSNLSFEDRGLHELKGLPDPRPIYAVTAS
jgi:class 3 adenylate cyclase